MDMLLKTVAKFTVQDLNAMFWITVYTNTYIVSYNVALWGKRGLYELI